MMPTAAEIRVEVEATDPPEGAVVLWWLGQASVLLRGAGASVYIDPYLTEMPERLVPPPFPADAAPPADLVLVTHDHIDHLDSDTLVGLAKGSREARFVVPVPLVSRLTGSGISSDAVIGVSVDEPMELGGVGLTAVPAMHAYSSPPAVYDFEDEGSRIVDRDPLYQGRHSYVGYVLDFGGVRVYHAGDTVIYDGMVERLRELDVDVALLPINGRSYFREQQQIVGNMDEREAAELAAASGVRLLIPIHYDMFATNLGRPGVLVDYVRERFPELACALPAHGRRFTYVKGG